MEEACYTSAPDGSEAAGAPWPGGCDIAAPPLPLDAEYGFVLDWSESWNAVLNLQVAELSRMGVLFDYFIAFDANGAVINPVNALLHPQSQPAFPLRFVYQPPAAPVAEGAGVLQAPLDTGVEVVPDAGAGVAPLPLQTQQMADLQQQQLLAQQQFLSAQQQAQQQQLQLQLQQQQQQLPQQQQPPRRLAVAAPVLIPLCRKGDRTAIERQLAAGASVDELDNEQNTPLHVAVEAPKNEVATVQCLLEHGANPNAVNYLGAVPLHYVCLRKNNHRGIANILFENGALINSTTLAGKSPLHFACENSLPELVEVLCVFGADPNLAEHEGNNMAHSVFIKEGGRDTVKRQILEVVMQYGVNFKVCNLQGLTPLHLACRGGYLRCAQLLHERGADVAALSLRSETVLHLSCLACFPNISQWILDTVPGLADHQDSEGNTPLHVCASVGNLESAVCLLRAGATPSLKNFQKRTALDIAKLRGTDLNNTHNPELVQVLQDVSKKHNCRQS